MTGAAGGGGSGGHFETVAVRTQVPTSPEREHSVPLYLTSSFVFDNAEQARALFADEIRGNIYSRYSNPNADELVQKLCLLEGAEDGIATASGMAAVFVALGSLLSAGDHVLAGRALFGSTHQILTRLLPRWGIDHSYADLADPDGWPALIRPTTKLIFVETPSNPGLDLVDLAWLGALARSRGVPLVVDNCFTTPYLQQPIRYGADLVIHSATKYLDGQGRAIGGILVGRAKLIEEARFFARHTGPAMSPFNAWLISKSLETLAVRMDRHCANALTLAQHFEGHPELESVRYPFLPSHPQYELARRQMCQGGGIVVLVVRGGLPRACRFLDALTLLSHSPNLSDEERARVGIVPGLVRISVGLEHIDDIIVDVDQALARSR